MGRGYGAFSVSHSHVEQVAAYIASQEAHIKRRPSVTNSSSL